MKRCQSPRPAYRSARSGPLGRHVANVYKRSLQLTRNDYTKGRSRLNVGQGQGSLPYHVQYRPCVVYGRCRQVRGVLIFMLWGDGLRISWWRHCGFIVTSQRHMTPEQGPWSLGKYLLTSASQFGYGVCNQDLSSWPFRIRLAPRQTPVIGFGSHGTRLKL